MKDNLEIRLSILLDNVGDLIHNSVNKEYSCISEQNLCLLGRKLRSIRTPTGVNLNELIDIEKFIKDITR